MRGDFDLAILGSGFAGSLMAMVARRLGLSVLLLERGAHPRFAIGESTSPLANLLLEELAHRYDLPRLLPFTSYGAWKRVYPEVGVGLKRGFSFYHHASDTKPEPDPRRERQLLVAASPSDEVADTHWYRSDFDQFLVHEAESLGAAYVDRTLIDNLTCDGDVQLLSGQREGRSCAYRAQFVVDATGPRGALSRRLGLPEAPFECLPGTQALFSHFVDVRPYAPDVASAGELPPYPPDAAALHHLFDGGWMWVLRFDNGVTSAGIAVEEALAEELRLTEREVAWRRFLERFPAIRVQFETATATLPLFHSPCLSYRCGRVSGPGWALLPSAAAFVDPLFSTGFPLTLLGIHRLGEAIAETWGTPAFETRLREYGTITTQEAEIAATLVGACYASFRNFPTFVSLSMLYFVAASFSEMARRLGRPDLASRFLLQNQERFRRAFRRHCTSVRRGAPSDLEAIAAEIEPFNIAGLCEAGKRNWYDVELNDVVRGAAKLEQTSEQVAAFFARMGW